MAVQKSKKSRSKKKIRKSSNLVFKVPCVSFNKDSNEFHLRHFITDQGFYKNKKIIDIEKKNKKKDNN